MWRNTSLIFGMCIDNVNLQECVDKIFQIIDTAHQRNAARYVATVNVDFLVNTYSCRLQRVRRPELLNALRNSELITADGMPIIWISRLLGCPLKERVTGADLIPALAERAAKSGGKMFFLGGRPGSGATTAKLLEKEHQGFSVSGIKLATVEVEGKELSASIEKDSVFVDAVNQANVAILLLSLGNPRQEVWFYRNRMALNVPVSIGIGGTFEVLAGAVPRAPIWMQNVGMEWVFRIFQEPKRLWKRYLIGIFKITSFGVPLVCYYTWRRILHTLFSAQTSYRYIECISSSDKKNSVAVLQLSACVDHTILPILEQKSKNMGNVSVLLLDFRAVRLITPVGTGYLIQLIQKMKSLPVVVCILNVPAYIRRLMICNRIWDVVAPLTFSSIESVCRGFLKSNSGLPLFYHLEYSDQTAIVSILGQLDNKTDSTALLQSVQSDFKGKRCIVDFSYCISIESIGLKLLINLQDALIAQGGACVLCSLNDQCRQALRIAQIDTLFTIVKDLNAAQSVPIQ